jgi:DNA topoisomerase-1
LGNKLIIVESPTKVKTLSKFLNSKYDIKASGGHIRDLPKTKMGVDIEKEFKPHYVIISKKKKIVSNLKKAAKGKKEIYLACDPDREGEAIAWHISQIIKTKADFKRVTFNELTKTVVVEAFNNPKNIDIRKVRAQQARRVLDRIVGYELSPLLWKKVSRGLSAGRVQSVALKILVEREREIEDFNPKEYWEIEAKLKKKEESKQKHPEFTAKLDKIKGKKPHFANKKEIDKLLEELENEEFIVGDVRNRKQKRKPKPPFITSTLQQKAFNNLKFTALRTMRIAQQLYEGVDIGKEGNAGLITYMRTDSVAVSEFALKQAREFIKNKYGQQYLPQKTRRYKSKKTAEAAHEAIRPTSCHRTPEKIKRFLTKDQYKVYKLIWSRFIASCMKDAQLLQTTVLIEAGDCLFKATGSKITFEGFMIVYNYLHKEDKKQKRLPPLKEKEKLDLLELIPSQHFTKAPPRFSDASLVKTLEEKNIGRPSTYAPIIHTIIARYYVGREGGYLRPSELGMVVNDLLVKHFPDILDIEFTAKMEEELDKIEENKLKYKDVLEEFYQPFMKDLKEAQIKMRNVKREVGETDQICEKCGRPMVIKWSRRGKFLSCSGFPECKNAKPLDTGIDCPEAGCDGKLIQRRTKSGRIFYGCTNYPKCKYVTDKLPSEKKEKKN